MNKILVTGASGFIGVNLINFLQSKHFKILAFSRKFGMDYHIIDPNYINDNEVNIIIHLAGQAHDLQNVINDQVYSKANTQLTNDIFTAFLTSKAKIFIYFSSVKAVKDHFDSILTENTEANPTSAYGKSKLAAEKHILPKFELADKKIFILRPCLIHGPENKGNLNLLYKIISNKIPWPLGAFDNKRSFCCIDNLCFIVNELIIRSDIPNGIYNIADDNSLSTNNLISLIGQSLNRKPKILSFNRNLIKIIAKIGDIVNLPLNTEKLNKLTESYVVSNAKIKAAIAKDLPFSTEAGLLKTFHSFIK